MISKKICLVGDFAVGKTSLIRRYVDRQFSDSYLSTVGVKISRKTIESEGSDRPTLQLLIWDVEGSTKFKAIAPSYLQGAKGAIIVADITRQETVDHLQEHVELFTSVNPQGFVVLAINKSDLAPPEKLESLLNDSRFEGDGRILSIYATSAKTGKNVDEIFQQLANKLV